MPLKTSPLDAPLIAHVIYRLDVGGLENGLVNLINWMPADRYRHAVVTLAGYTEFRKRLRPGVEVYSLDKRPGKDFPCYGRFIGVLRRLRPAVVHTRNFGTLDLQVLARLARVPGRVHGEHGWEMSDIDGVSARRIRLRRMVAPGIHRFIAVSRDIRRWLLERVGLPADRVTQIYNGVDSSRFGPEGPAPEDSPWKHETRAFTVAVVGRLEATKNQQLALHALRAMLKSTPSRRTEIRVLIAGDGPDRDYLLRLARDLGVTDHVWFAGARQDVAAFYRACDVFVLPSLNEGISNTILEAMASGRPVVAGDVGGNPELVMPGVNGMLFDPRDPDSLANCLLGYIGQSERMRREGAASRQLVTGRFAPQRMVEDYCAVYDSVLRRGVT